MSDQISENIGEDIPGGQESEASIKERLAELKRRAAQMAKAKKAMKREEKNTKQSEDKVVHFLIKFIQSKHNDVLLGAVSKALANNISANIVLYALLLTNNDLLEEIDNQDFEDEDLLKLKEGVHNLKMLNSGQIDTSSLQLQVFKNNTTIPEELKIKLHFWGEGLFEAALVYPHKTFETFQNEEAQISFKYMLSVILSQFFDIHRITITRQKSLDPLIDRIFIGILEKITDRIEKTLYLE